MPIAQIGTSREHLALAPATELGTSGVVVATLHAGGLTAQASVALLDTRGFDGLATFFSDMAASWRGWDGQRAWESLEGELSIEATHDRRVRLTVTLHRAFDAWGNDGWLARAHLVLDPGEQLSRVARDVAALDRGEE